jgi:ferritin-like protein
MHDWLSLDPSNNNEADHAGSQRRERSEFAMPDYHEPVEELRPEDRDFIRALTSMKEEIEAIIWYHQRVVTCSDGHLKNILAHNRDEEVEHAVMILEWLRRSMPEWEEQLKLYLFTTGDLTEIEEAEETPKAEEQAAHAQNSFDLGIGSLKER